MSQPPPGYDKSSAPPPYPGGPPPPGFNQPPPASYPPPGAYPGYPPPQAYPPPSSNYMVSTSGTVMTTTAPMTTTTVVMTGNCPRCHVGNLIEESNTVGLVCIILLVILFFPIGLLYLLCLPGATERRCPNCGYCSG